MSMSRAVHETAFVYTCPNVSVAANVTAFIHSIYSNPKVSIEDLKSLPSCLFRLDSRQGMKVAEMLTPILFAANLIKEGNSLCGKAVVRLVGNDIAGLQGQTKTVTQIPTGGENNASCVPPSSVPC